MFFTFMLQYLKNKKVSVIIYYKVWEMNEFWQVPIVTVYSLS